MKKIVVVYGLASGFILAGISAILTPYCMTQKLPNAELIGYTTMVLSFLCVFFGIRSYRENVNAGVITFGKAFRVGILISLITCGVYVVGWEIVYHSFFPDFADTYSAAVLDKLKAGGATAERVEAERQKMLQFKKLYANPFFNVGITFMEVFPVGLVVTLVSAGILRRKSAPGAPGAVAATA